MTKQKTDNDSNNNNVVLCCVCGAELTVEENGNDATERLCNKCLFDDELNMGELVMY